MMGDKFNPLEHVFTATRELVKLLGSSLHEPLKRILNLASSLASSIPKSS
jgi:hypothetical protein